MGRTARRVSPHFAGPSYRRNLPLSCLSAPGTGHASPPGADASLKLHPPSLLSSFIFQQKQRAWGSPVFVLRVPSACRVPATPALFVFACPAPIAMSKLAPNHRCRLSSTYHVPLQGEFQVHSGSALGEPLWCGSGLSPADSDSRKPPGGPLADMRFRFHSRHFIIMNRRRLEQGP